jgi:preprotein translocase subunit SecE
VKSIIAYFREARAELVKVNWPDRRSALQMTLTVVVFSIAISVFIAGLDYVFSTALQRLILKG